MRWKTMMRIKMENNLVWLKLHRKQGLQVTVSTTVTILWCVLTFTAVRGNFSEGVVTAVTLTSDDAGFALTLATFSVTCSGERADRVAVTQKAVVTTFKTVVVVLETGSGERKC